MIHFTINSYYNLRDTWIAREADGQILSQGLRNLQTHDFFVQFFCCGLCQTVYMIAAMVYDLLKEAEN